MQLDWQASVPLIAYGKLRRIHDIAARPGRPSLNDQVMFRSKANGTIMGMVAEGLGAAVMPRTRFTITTGPACSFRFRFPFPYGPRSLHSGPEPRVRIRQRQPH